MCVTWMLVVQIKLVTERGYPFGFVHDRQCKYCPGDKPFRKGLHQGVGKIEVEQIVQGVES